MKKEWNSYLIITVWRDKAAVDSYLDTFLIIDPANHPHTHFSNLTEGWLLQTDIPEDLDHPFSYTDTSVLNKENNSIHKALQCYLGKTLKQGFHLQETQVLGAR